MWISKKDMAEIQSTIQALKLRVADLENANSFEVYESEPIDDLESILYHFRYQKAHERISHTDAIKKLADHAGLKFELSESKKAKVILSVTKKPSTARGKK